MVFFTLHAHCYWVSGSCKSAIYDVLQKRVFWVEEPERRIFLDESRRGKSLEEISRLSGAKPDDLAAYAKLLENLDLGARYEKPKVSMKYRPFITPDLEKKNGFFSPLSVITLEMASSCEGECRRCRFSDRAATVECLCGIYSKTPRVAYNLRAVIRDLSFSPPSLIQLAGGDPYVNRDDVELVLQAAAEVGIPVKVNTPGYLLQRHDLELLQRFNASLSLVLPAFDPQNPGKAGAVFSNVLRLASETGFTNLEAVLIGDYEEMEIFQRCRQWLHDCGLAVERFAIYSDPAGAGFENVSFLNASPGHFAIGVDGLSRGIRGHACWQDMLCIMADGTVRPCIAAEDISYGNVCHARLSEIIRKSRSEEVVGVETRRRGACGKCEFALGCFSCSVTTRKLKGEGQEPAWNCGYNPEAGEFVKKG